MKIGLALGGGGAKGSYQIGVFKALEETGLLSYVKTVSGTSIGALNASLIMGKMPLEEMRQLWLSITNKMLYTNIERFKQDKLGVFNQEIMYKILIEKQDKNLLKESPIDGFVVLSKLKDLGLRKQLKQKDVTPRVVYLNNKKDPYKYILASASVPVLFGPTKIGDNYYVDGGLVDNLPVDILLEKGCNIIFTVGLSPSYDLDAYGENALIIDLSPPKKLGRTILTMLDFNPKYIDHRIDYGYGYTMEVLNFLISEGVLSKEFNFDVTKKGVYTL